MRVRCAECGNETDFSLDLWRCACGGAWEPASLSPFDPDKIRTQDHSIWRYGDLLDVDSHTEKIQMGVGWTPLVPVAINDRKVHLKLEYLSPSGSFKDRGVNVMVNQLVNMGVKTVIEDSSGNAGASLAAHAARFGIEAEIYVPAYASLAKQYQIKVYGADVIPIPGSRKAAEEAAQRAVGPGKAYASHAYNPAYLVGQMTAAYEIWEQLGRKAPNWLIFPVAQGGLFLGCWFGFRQLLGAGLILEMPHLVAVQAAKIAPFYQAWVKGLTNIPAIEAAGPTLAEGVAISKPVRAKRLLQALKETDGRVAAISEDGIRQAQKALAHLGYFVEPTSALVYAGYQKIKSEIDENDTVVLTLTGNGLKGSPQST